jgi:hypothetical protein
VGVDLDRDIWTAVVKLAVTISIVAGLAAVLLSTADAVPQSAIVLAVIVVAFAASWIQTGRVQRQHATVPFGPRRHT